VAGRLINLAAQLLDRNLERGLGDRPALLWDGGRWTFAELARAANRAGNALLDLGLRRGDVVLLRLPFNPEGVACLLGAIRAGLVPALTSILLGPQELEPILANSEARLAVTAPELAEPLGGVRVVTALPDASEALEPVLADPEDTAYILYTSGSTGRPKGVLRPHRTLEGSAGPNCDALMGLTEADVCYQPHQDLAFSYPLGHGLMFPLYAGAAAVADPARGPDGRFDPAACFRAMAAHGVTVFTAATPVYRRLAEVVGQAPRGLRVRLWSASAEPLPPEVLALWEERFGRPVYETMGQSECPSFIGHYPGLEIRPGCLGKPFPGVDVRVLRDDLTETGPEEPGFLAIRADYPGLCSGYRKAPERWAAVCHDGWYFTQDMVRRDADGYVWYVCRADEVLKVHGYTVAPHEVEAALQTHPGVRDAAVVGRDGALVAYVVPRAGASPAAEELRAHVRGRLAPYKVPSRVVFRDDLPRTQSGKLKRRDLIQAPD
jgi:acyl-coenzyme A synthetase/AMP-(fatty) acid ligase